MFDLKELKLLIIRKFDSQRKFAEAMNRTTAFVCNVLNGKTYLYAPEIDRWAEALDIKPEEIGFYFFNK